MTDRVRVLIERYESLVPLWGRILAVLGWAALIWWSSSQTFSGLPGTPLWQHLTNGAHVGAYGVLAALAWMSTRGTIPWRGGCAVALAVAYGVLDEIHQGSVGRRMDAWDLCSDALGAILAVLALTWVFTGSRRAVSGLAFCALLAGISVHMAARS